MSSTEPTVKAQMFECEVVETSSSIASLEVLISSHQDTDKRRAEGVLVVGDCSVAKKGDLKLDNRDHGGGSERDRTRTRSETDNGNGRKIVYLDASQYFNWIVLQQRPPRPYAENIFGRGCVFNKSHTMPFLSFLRSTLERVQSPESIKNESTGNTILLEASVTTSESQPPLFALIIGINKYQSFSIPFLRGAVPDANAVQSYLQKHLAVPSSQIRNLRDSEATRAAIIREVNALTADDRIQHGDPILIFYAGHGSTAPAPAGWEAAAPGIQLIVPHDHLSDNGKGGKVYGIPDRTLGVLLGRLASAKGDNVTVIFDCCYSGSGTRTDDVDSSRLVRGIDTKEELPTDLDRDIYNSSSGKRVAEVAHGFAKVASESAQELGGRGFFTKALLDVLVACGTDKLTYKDLLQRIPALPGYRQNPQCEGFFQERTIFHSKAPSQQRVLYKIRREGDKLVMDAGAAHGIVNMAHFAVYRDRESTLEGTQLGTVVALHVDPFTTTLDITTDGSRFLLPEGGYALQTRAGIEEGLRVHIEVDEKLTPVFDVLGREMQRASSQMRILLVEKERAELDFALEGGYVVVNLLDSVVTTLGLTRMPFRIEPTADAHTSTWHLRRKSKTQALHKKIEVEFTELIQSEEEYDDDLQPVIQPIGPNLNRENIVDLQIKSNAMYGIKITNNLDVPLYPSLFFFDNSDLSIGGVPYRYFLRNGQDVDVGYLKLFLSTEHVDLSHVPQHSPFADLRVEALADIKTTPTWDTILIPVVQRMA
ncbi:hypothetical protein BU15DRAFT_61646 [Melanogaster broomeanus]|nr:hypothetical protein BU15DRAFT_61646 [Melanogaster broomeanus]